MITSRGLVEGDETTTLKMLVFDELETVRSVQLYGTDPVYVGKAAEILCAEYGVAHIDLNFGCPVPKVTRKGGGGGAAVEARVPARRDPAGRGRAPRRTVPVTMKTRKGIDDDHLTYLDAGRIAEDEGVAAIALHGRTVEQAYSGRPTGTRSPSSRRARRHPGARQRRHLGGRRRAADGRADRLRRRRRRPRLPGPAVAVPRPGRGLRREQVATLPDLGEVAAMMRRHAELLAEHMGEERGCKEFRKHVAWYLKGFPAGGELRHRLGPRRHARRPRRPARRARPGRAVPTDGHGCVIAEDAYDTSGG
jgi:tRNA-dihydrouridine synthase